MSIKSNPKLEKVAKKFRKISPNINKSIAVALKKAALLVERESKFVTPVDTGRLRASIFSTIYETSAVVQPKTDYAIHVHRRKPFMKEGLDKARPRIEKIFRGAVHLSISKALR